MDFLKKYWPFSFETVNLSNLIVKTINSKEKIRLMELGLVENCCLQVLHKSVLKKTLLIAFSNSCFTINEDVAKGVEVFYG